MRPRLVFLCCVCAIIAFGLLMVYSASSVEALTETGSSTYYFTRQAMFIGASCLVAAFVVLPILPWELFRSDMVWVPWGIVVVLLIVVMFVGSGGESWGATRWISLGAFTLQPSELAKPAIILVMAKLFADFYEDCSIDAGMFVLRSAIAVGVPAIFIIGQPDMGTTVIIVATVFFMAYLAGMSYRLAGIIVLVAAVAVVLMIVAAPYRFTRFLISLDPWSDPYDTGFQATLAIMAFASGGLFGRGIGNSTMKYNYLPEAHNDYILAIVGEELGFVGTVIFVAVFVVMIVAAFKIAKRSPTLYGQMVAAGCAIVLMLQFLINALGILGVIPMTGKPLPFVSYGGSSVLASIILAALILRVSLESNVRTAADERRGSLAVMGRSVTDDVSSHLGRSTAGAASPRSARMRGDDARARAADASDACPRARDRGFSVYEGGEASRPDMRAGSRSASRGSVGRGGYERIDLNERDRSERLRTSETRTRGTYGRPGSYGDYGTAGRTDRASRGGARGRGNGPGRRDGYDR